MWNASTQVVQTFGEGNLVRLSVDNVNELLLPDSAKLFLMDIGLPKDDVLMCKFNVSERKFQTIQEYADRKGLQYKVKEQYRIIGYDGYCQICFHEGISNGEIVAINIEKNNSICFMNNSIELLCGFLALYVENYCKHKQLPDEELNDLAFKFEEKIKKYDPKAFYSSKNWWPQITYQMKNGLL